MVVFCTLQVTEVARSQKSPHTGKLSKRPDSTWAGLLSSQESLRRFLPATPSPRLPRTPKILGMRLFRQAESIGPMGSLKPLKAGAGVPPPVGRPRGPAKGRDGRGAPCSSSATSSDRLFLDRVARQHCPSPLHRHGQNNMRSPEVPGNGDISTLLGKGTFLLCLDTSSRVVASRNPS